MIGDCYHEVRVRTIESCHRDALYFPVYRTLDSHWFGFRASVAANHSQSLVIGPLHIVVLCLPGHIRPRLGTPS